MNAPKAKRVSHPLEMHGDIRQDDYYWLRDRTNPEVIAYLEAENEYYEEVMRPLAPLSEQLFSEMTARIPESEQQVPVQDGPYFYYTRLEKELQYPIFARKRVSARADLPSAPEEVVLDQNTLAQDGEYLSVSVQRVSPDHSHLAYLENRDGSDQFTLFVKNLRTGELLPDRIDGVFIYGSLEWDGTGEYLFYITVDESQRPFRLWRHRLGDTGPDALLFEESDITFSIHIGKSSSGAYLFMKSASKITDEVHYLPADRPTAEWTMFDARRSGIQYDVEHWNDDFLILTNEGAINFRLMHCSVDHREPTSRKNLFPYDENRFLQAVQPFASGVIVEGRQDGLTQIWLYQDDQLTMLSWQEPLFNVTLGHNLSYATQEVLLQYESLLTPKTTLSLDLSSGAIKTLQVTPVAGDYDPLHYCQERLWAKADDGVSVPMLVVYRKGALDHGPAPLFLNGYGSYGANSDPHFDPYRLPLLDRGIVVVVAQIRGGSEMGRHWYEDGKLLQKRNTFTDFVACARDLIARNYTVPHLQAARGGSAGGLLVGAVANLAGELFQVIAPAVPFVDVVTTMLDASIPLTSMEWDEWGNPEDAEYYHYMKSYSPYDNVEAKAYPHLFVTTGLNDPRVAYWEPAKWVARLRATKTDDHTLVLKTNMGAGHFGASGRFNRLKELAGSYAFLLDKLGVSSVATKS